MYSRGLVLNLVSARDLLYPPTMSKSSKRGSKHGRRGTRGVVDRSATTDVVTQLECALRNPHAALIGAVVGGLVPWFGRTLAHGEIQDAWSGGNLPLALAMVVVVIGCGAFSGLSVYKFGRAAFGDPRKALGFVLALEGVMLVSHGATSAVALAVLVLINAVANGSVIALARDATRRRRDGDARGAAARASSRASARGAKSREPHVAPPPLADAPVASSVPPAVHPSRGPGSALGRALLAPTRWRRATLGDVADAEIVTEKFLA